MRIQARSRLRNIRRGNPPKRLGKRQWVGKREKRGPEHGLDFRGDGHEREVDPWRYRALACNLVRARRYRNHNPPFEVRCSAPALVVYQGPRKRRALPDQKGASAALIEPCSLLLRCLLAVLKHNGTQRRERYCWGKAGRICHDNTLSFKGLDIRSRPLTFQLLAQAMS